MGHNTYLRKLFCIKSPYQGGDRNEGYFWKAMRETCSDFVEHSGEYREICRLYGFSPNRSIPSKIWRGYRPFQPLI